jgi:hypothetical protein
MAWNLVELHQIGISPEMGRWPFKESDPSLISLRLARGHMD